MYVYVEYTLIITPKRTRQNGLHKALGFSRIEVRWSYRSHPARRERGGGAVPIHSFRREPNLLKGIFWAAVKPSARSCLVDEIARYPTSGLHNLDLFSPLLQHILYYFSVVRIKVDSGWVSNLPAFRRPSGATSANYTASMRKVDKIPWIGRYVTQQLTCCWLSILVGCLNN